MDIHCNREKRMDKQYELWVKKWTGYSTSKPNRDSDTSSEASYTSTSVPSDITHQKLPQWRNGIDISKEILDSIPVFDGKQGELNQFLSTIESYSRLYRVWKVDLVMLWSRGKVHEIISHVVTEEPDVKWSTICKKLTSNCSSTRSSIEANVKIDKLQMTNEETVGEYLARARTLIKTKLKNLAQWSTEYNDMEAFHVCNGLIKAKLKSRMLPWVSKYNSYKDCFNNIENEWNCGYFIEDNFAEQSKPATEVNKIQEWEEAIVNDPHEVELLAEVNEVYQCYGRQPPQSNQYGYYSAQGTKFQGSKLQQNRGSCGGYSHSSQQGIHI